MSTVIIALIMVTFVMVVCILLVSINSKHRRNAAAEKMKDMKDRLNIYPCSLNL
jgi:signal transduction histidine kinase